MEIDSMGCPNGKAHNYQWDNECKKLVCLNCGRISLHQPVSHSDLFEKYNELLQKSKELVDGEMSLNEFTLFIGNLS